VPRMAQIGTSRLDGGSSAGSRLNIHIRFYINNLHILSKELLAWMHG